MSSCHRRFSAGAGASNFASATRRTHRAAPIVYLDRIRANPSPEIALRLSTKQSTFLVRVAAAGDSWRGREDRKKTKRAGPCSYAVGDSKGGGTGLDRTKAEVGKIWRWKVEKRMVEVTVAAAATVVLGVGNRVLYKLALVPLKQYPFFLAQLATVGYFLSLPIIFAPNIYRIFNVLNTFFFWSITC